MTEAHMKTLRFFRKACRMVEKIIKDAIYFKSS